MYATKYWRAVGDEGWNYLTPLHNQYYPNWSAPNNVAGFQEARTGNSYIGMLLYHLHTTIRNGRREYIQLIACACT